MIMLTKKKRRRWVMGLSTILGFRQQGFFLPCRYASSAQPIAYPRLAEAFRIKEPSFEDKLALIRAYSSDILALPGKGTCARFDQTWYPGLDALFAYTMVRNYRPKRIVEVGSGHSTRFLAAAIQDSGLKTDLICIDPAPRAPLGHLNVQWRSSILQKAPMMDFEALEAGDLLFIDSSHLLMPGTDVDYLIGHILPGLEPGVYVHIHDIFLPDPYPRSWTWRGYNEQSVVAALLQGDGYELLFSSHYVATRMEEKLNSSPFNELDIAGIDLQSSLWLQKRSSSF